MRIREPATKVRYVIVVVIVITLTAVPLAAISYGLGFAWTTTSLMAAFILAARTFRSGSESDGPRPWWKATSTRGSGILVCALFFVPGVTALLGASSSPTPALAAVGGVLALAASAFCLNSAVRTQPPRASR